MTARTTDPLPPTSSMIAANSGSRSIGMSVLTVSPTALSSAGSSNRMLPPRVTRSRRASEDLLLAVGAREVALAGPLADARVGERLGPGEVVLALADHEPGRLQAEAVVAGAPGRFFLTFMSTPPTASTMATNPAKSTRA